ncbi:hypothetical protein FXO38_04778 [Capsicum annuum]|nr:hypothetical protein FXO38_04778 [Capsicum annuum]
MLGVLEVYYDPKTNLATIRGNFDPLMVIEAIKRKGKHAELISYSKNPLYDHQAHNSTSRSSNHHYNKEEAAAYCNTKDKGKAKVGENNQRNEHCWNGSNSSNSNHHYNKEEAAAYCNTKDKGKAKVGDNNKRNEHCWNGSNSSSSDDENSNDDNHIHECEDYVSAKNSKCEDFVSNKNTKKYHKAEAYVPPKGVDEAICRDRFCKIHRRGGGLRDYVTQEERQKKYDMFMQMGGQYPAGFFNGGATGYMPPPYPYYCPDYGFYQPGQPMSGVYDFTRYYGDKDSRTCSIV